MCRQVSLIAGFLLCKFFKIYFSISEKSFGNSFSTFLNNSEIGIPNKCAIVCVGKTFSLLGERKRSIETSYACERGLSHELINFEPSPEFLSSSQLTKKFNPQHKVQTGSHASPQLCGSLCLTEREGNRTSVGAMKEGSFSDKVFSRFTSHFSLRKAGAASNFHGCFGKILNDNWQMTY